MLKVEDINTVFQSHWNVLNNTTFIPAEVRQGHQFVSAGLISEFVDVRFERQHSSQKYFIDTIVISYKQVPLMVADEEGVRPMIDDRGVLLTYQLPFDDIVFSFFDSAINHVEFRGVEYKDDISVNVVYPDMHFIISMYYFLCRKTQIDRIPVLGIYYET